MPGDQPHRKRMRRYEVPGGVRFLTFSCQRRLPLLRNAGICRLFLERLAATRAKFGLAVYAWVLMPEHVHLLVRPGIEPLDRALASLKTSVAKRVIARWTLLDAPILERVRTNSGSPRYWQKGGGHDRNVRDIYEFRRKVRYIHRNPVERGLVELSEDREWSSVRWWVGERHGEFPCDPPPGDPGMWDLWTGFR